MLQAEAQRAGAQAILDRDQEEVRQEMVAKVEAAQARLQRAEQELSLSEASARKSANFLPQNDTMLKQREWLMRGMDGAISPPEPEPQQAPPPPPLLLERTTTSLSSRPTLARTKTWSPSLFRRKSAQF